MTHAPGKVHNDGCSFRTPVCIARHTILFENVHLIMTVYTPYSADPETPSRLKVDTEQDSIKVEWVEVVMKIINAVCSCAT